MIFTSPNWMKWLNDLDNISEPIFSPIDINEHPMTAIDYTLGFISSLGFAIICINSWNFDTFPLPAYENDNSIVLK